MSNIHPYMKYKTIEKTNIKDRVRCRICGRRKVRMEYDHKFPKSRGGKGVRLICLRCNRIKSDKVISDTVLQKRVKFSNMKKIGVLAKNISWSAGVLVFLTLAAQLWHVGFLFPLFAVPLLTQIQEWRTCPITNRKYKLLTARIKELRNSPFNPRELTQEHVDELKESMEVDGQLTPLTCVEREKSSDDIKYDILDGKHRFEAARQMSLDILDCKVYSKNLTPTEQKKLAIYLNKGVKKINAGEFFRAADELYRLTDKELKDNGAKVINESRIIMKAGIRDTKGRFEMTIGRIVHRLQSDSSAKIHDNISDSQTPARKIIAGTKTVFTAANIGAFLKPLCRVPPLGPWEPHKTGDNPEEYEAKLIKGIIKEDDNFRDIEYKNAIKLTNIIDEELIQPWMDAGTPESAIAFCKHHVLKASSEVIKHILLVSGSNNGVAPLYVSSSTKIDWDNVRKYIKKFRNVIWTDPMFDVRVPDVIKQHLWTFIFP